MKTFKTKTMRSLLLASVATGAVAVLSACTSASGLGLAPGETFKQGYVVDEQTLDLVPPGSSREQVLLALGTPTTINEYDNEVFYYISQTRKRGAQFMKAKLVDQRVLAVYFDDQQTVERIANYGLQDGKVFDFISRTTPTAGRDETFLAQVLTGTFGGATPSLPGAN